jgi:hypothetical protein
MMKHSWPSTLVVRRISLKGQTPKCLHVRQESVCPHITDIDRAFLPFQTLAACKRYLQKWLELLAFPMAIFGYDYVSTAVEHLAAIRTRIIRSLDDPRLDMTLAEVDAHLAALFARSAQTGDPAPTA